MNNLRRRKFNTLYLVLTTIAICTAIMTRIEYTRILGMLLCILMMIFVQFDERSEYAFPDPDGDEDGEI